MACPEERGDGSVAFATVGRPQYGFDIFSCPFPAEALPAVDKEQGCGVQKQEVSVPQDSLQSRVCSVTGPAVRPELGFGAKDDGGASAELKHTDGQSVNFTGHFLSAAVVRGWLKQGVGGNPQPDVGPEREATLSQAFEGMHVGSEGQDLGLVFVSERGGSPSLYGTVVRTTSRKDSVKVAKENLEAEKRRKMHTDRPGSGESGSDDSRWVRTDDVSGKIGGVTDPTADVGGAALVAALTDGFAMEDRPSMTADGKWLVFTSTREDSGKAHLSWSAVYRMDQKTGAVLRLTPGGHADFSPDVSPDGTLVAAAMQPGVGSLHVSEPYTFDVVVFDIEDGGRRRHVARNGGWPVFTPDSKAVYFHRKCEDGWWSIFKAQVPPPDADSLSAPSDASEVRITPRGMHAVTPAVDPSGEWLAVATRRTDSKYRHIELLNLVTGRFILLTKPSNPEAHHYGPFFSPDGTRVGYHRSRGVGPRVNAGGGSGEVELTEEDDWMLVHGKVGEGRCGVNGDFVGCPVRASPQGESFNTGQSNRDVTSSLQVIPAPKQQREVLWKTVESEKPEQSTDQFTVPNVEFVRSPYPETALLRVEGSFPAFSPDGSKLAMVHNMGSEGGEIVVMNSDGSDRRTLVRARAFGLSWGTSGELFYSEGPIFASERTSVRVAKVRIPGSAGAAGGAVGARAHDSADVTVLTSEGTGNNAFSSASPDGGRVVFRSSRSGHKNLYVMTSVEGDRGELFRLTEGAWDDTMPNWSPSGDWIAFSSDRERPGSGGFDIFVVRPDGTGLRKLVNAEGGRANHPAFSPDSARVTFAGDFAWVSAEPVVYPRQFQPYGEVYVVDIDGSNLRRMTHNGYEDGTVAWGRKFVGQEEVSREGLELTGQITDSISM